MITKTFYVRTSVKLTEFPLTSVSMSENLEFYNWKSVGTLKVQLKFENTIKVYTLGSVCYGKTATVI